MDSNIDANIDPNIESQSTLFTKFSIGDDYNAAHDAFISHQQNPNSYLNAIEDPSNNANNSSALSSILNFNQIQELQERVNSSSAPSSPIINENRHQRPQQRVRQQHSSQQPAQESLSFIQNALTIAQQPSSLPSLTERALKPKQKLLNNGDAQVSIVVVDPSSNEGTRRLGRPRKNRMSTPNTSETSSSKNFNESLLSRFRFDSLPVMGPGSRGGRRKKSSLITKPGRQAKLGKGTKGLNLVIENGAGDKQYVNHSIKKEGKKSEFNEDDYVNAPEEHEAGSVRDPKTDNQAETVVEITPKDKKSNSKIVLEDYESLQAKGRSTARDEAYKNPKKRAKDTFKRRKDPTSSIVPSVFDIYISRNIEVGKNEELNKIALGYKVKPSNFARDIMFILEFVFKFRKFFDDFPNLGPQDFEEGLNLPSSEPYGLKNVNQEIAELRDYDKNTNVSPLMDEFFFRLLSLVLNRKRAKVDKVSLTRALEELKTQVLIFGLPVEWRDDSGVFNEDKKLDETLKSNSEDVTPVDPNNDEVLDVDQHVYESTKPLPHTPLDNDDFETTGLASLKPVERLVLLRSLTQWCLSYSDAVKLEINDILQSQDPAGEKETYYVSRFVKEGKKGVERANQDLKRSIQRRKKRAGNDDSDDNINTNNDPTADPLSHHMSFRLLDFFAGDAGINGRFYLCRTAGPKSGGFATYHQLLSLLQKDHSIHDLLGNEQPSRFKLYVEDVSTMLKNINSSSTDIIDPWYEVASDVSQLRNFLEYLQRNASQNIPTQVSNLYNYLNSLFPILEKYETIATEYKDLKDPNSVRSTRKREQVTNQRENRRAVKEDLQYAEENEVQSQSENEDEVEDEEEEEEDELDYELPDDNDDDDDDYRE